MNELLVAIIGASGLIGVALISNRGRQHAKAAREQVENSHQTNLRDELDTRHEENLATLTEHSEKLDELVTWKDTHQAQANKALARIAEIEKTIPPQRRRKK